jgi:hypothetical protein
LEKEELDESDSDGLEHWMGGRKIDILAVV